VIACPTLGEHQRPWDALVDAAPNRSPFLRSWWLDSVRGDDAIFVLVFEAEELIGGLAVTRAERRGIGRVRLLPSGALWPQGLDTVARVGREKAVVRAALDLIRGWGRLGALVELGGTFADSALVRFAPARSRVVTIDESMSITPPADYEAFLAARPRHLRQEIRRIERRLTERGVVYRTVADPAAVEHSLVEFDRLHRLRWQGGSGFAPALPAFIRAACAGAARGEVIVHEVACGDRILATLVTFEVGTTCLFYQMGRDPDPKWSGTGLFLRSQAMRRSCELKHTKVDLGTGSPEQKIPWIDERRAVVRVAWGHRLGRAVFAWRLVKQPLARVFSRS
jgi:hypothetical protein